MAASKDVRRVVTTVDQNGKAVVLLDGANPHAKARAHGTVSHLLWVADETPVDMRGPKDRAAREIGIAPPAGGSVFRIVDFPPDAQVTGGDAAQLFAEFGAAAAHAKDGRHAMMHKTATVDYALVLDGEVVAVMDVGEAVMRAGDVLIQRGTNHSWANRSDRPCRVAFILVDAEPL